MSEENKNLPKVEKVENNEEKGSKKRDIIKNVAIIFLAVMLLLTFFSNTGTNTICLLSSWLLILKHTTEL